MQKLERMINRRVWLWIVLFLAGLFFCWIIFSKLSKNIKNDDNTQVTGRLIHNTKEAGVTVNGEEKIQKTQSIWLVKEWKSDSAQLSLENDRKETLDLIADPKKMLIMIPFNKNIQEIKGMKKVDDLNSLDWQTAFCPGDEVNLGTDENNQAVNIINIGYRMCGFKGE